MFFLYTHTNKEKQYMATASTFKGEMENNTLIAREFHSTHTSMHRSSRHKNNKGTQALNNALDQMDLIDMYRSFHPNEAEYTFFSSAHGTLSRTDYILSHKSSLSKLKKIGIISHIFYEQMS